MTTITLTLDLETEPGDDSEALVEQLLAGALAEHGIEYQGLVAAHKGAIPVREEPLEEFFNIFDGLADSIYSNGYGEQIRQLDDLRESLHVRSDTTRGKGAPSGSTESEFSDHIAAIADAIEDLEANRDDPEHDPELVSYALDDLNRHISELRKCAPQQDNE